jgi:hypothetical protein
MPMDAAMKKAVAISRERSSRVRTACSMAGRVRTQDAESVNDSRMAREGGSEGDPGRTLLPNEEPCR